MKIIITESQFEELKEISFLEGALDRFPLSDAVDIINQIGFKKFYNFLDEYLIKNYKIELDKIDEAKRIIRSFLEDISNNYISQELNIEIDSKKLKFLNNYKVISHIVYKFFKKEMKLYDFEDLKFFIFKKKDNIYFWFFTRDEKSFLGLIKGNFLMDRVSDDDLIRRLGRKSFVVSLSSVVYNMKGKGYGKQMYLAVLDYSDTILSDENLFAESKNIWVYSLPKYARKVGFITKNSELRPLEYLDDYRDQDIYRFFATNKKISWG